MHEAVDDYVDLPQVAVLLEPWVAFLDEALNPGVQFLGGH